MQQRLWCGDNGGWRIRTNRELQVFYGKPEFLTEIKRNKLRENTVLNLWNSEG